MVPKRAVILRGVSGLAVGFDIDFEMSAVNIWLGIVSVTVIWDLENFRDTLVGLSKDNLKGEE